MTAVATRPGTWREARKDLPVLGKDGHVWTLAKLEKEPNTGRPLVTMTRTVAASGQTLQPIPIEKAVLVNWDDPINVVIKDAPAAPEAPVPTPYEPPAREHAVGDQVQVGGITFTKHSNGAGPSPLQQGPAPVDPGLLGNTTAGWAVPPTADWTAAELHSHAWLMHGWTEPVGTVAQGHVTHDQLHANPTGGLPHFHRSTS